MTASNAAASGQFAIGDAHVHRLGFGSMRITGAGIWGMPQDRPEALRVLRRLPELGVNLIDTADSYGPFTSENLICEALHPYDSTLLIATKGGLTRQGPDRWQAVGRPEYLRQCVLMSLRRDEQFGVIREMQQEGLIRHVGLSQVGVEAIRAAQKYFPVATVQNRFNLDDRADEAVLDFCAAEGIGFIPWRPLDVSGAGRPGGPLARITQRVGATPHQVALAWLLKRSSVILPIPGTSRVAHLDENVGAAAVSLSDQDMQDLNGLGRSVS